MKYLIFCWKYECNFLFLFFGIYKMSFGDWCEIFYYEVHQVAWENLYTSNIDNIFSYINAIETCNTAMEREFSQLSGFVQVKKQRPLIKSTDWFERGPVDFGKWANSQVMVKLRSLSTIWKLPWYMTIN